MNEKKGPFFLGGGFFLERSFLCLRHGCFTIFNKMEALKMRDKLLLSRGYGPSGRIFSFNNHIGGVFL